MVLVCFCFGNLYIHIFICIMLDAPTIDIAADLIWLCSAWRHVRGPAVTGLNSRDLIRRQDRATHTHNLLLSLKCEADGDQVLTASIWQRGMMNEYNVFVLGCRSPWVHQSLIIFRSSLFYKQQQNLQLSSRRKVNKVN